MPAAPHAGVFQKMEQPNWPQLYILMTLCRLAYYHNTDNLDALVANQLGFQAFPWIETPGNVTVNLYAAGDADGAIFVFSGTENFDQIAFYSGFYSALYTYPQVSNAVSYPFLSIFLSCKPFIDTVINSLPAGTPLLFSGHSLGGAIAQVAATFYSRAGGYNVVNCVPFASPSVGNSACYFWRERAGGVVLRTRGDPIPYLPPTGQPLLISDLQNILTLNTFVYASNDPQWVLEEEAGEAYEENFEYTSGTLLLLCRVIAAGALTAFDPDLPYVIELHYSPTYCHRLREMCRVNRQLEGLQFWDGLNAIMDHSNPQTGDLVFGTAPNIAAILNYTSNTGPIAPANAPPPILTQPVTLTTTTSTSQPASAAGNQTAFFPAIASGDQAAFSGFSNPSGAANSKRPDYTFKTEDRRLLEKFVELCNAIQRRDNKAKTRALTWGISTRARIIPPAGHPLYDAFFLLFNQAQQLLELFDPM